MALSSLVTVVVVTCGSVVIGCGHAAVGCRGAVYESSQGTRSEIVDADAPPGGERPLEKASVILVARRGAPIDCSMLPSLSAKKERWEEWIRQTRTFVGGDSSDSEGFFEASVVFGGHFYPGANSFHTCLCVAKSGYETFEDCREYSDRPPWNGAKLEIYLREL